MRAWAGLDKVAATSPGKVAGNGAGVDNAVAESCFATLECELIERRAFQTQAEARMGIFQFIEVWYNTRRRHIGLGLPESQRLQARRRGVS